MKKENKQRTAAIEPSTIADKIFFIRKQKVMLDSNLAELYEVSTKHLNQQVRRNLDRFPSDFMFQLTSMEMEQLNWSQFVTSSQKHRRHDSHVYAFTEHGVAMLSSVLRSERAVQMNIFIIRTFVKMRELLPDNKEFRLEMDEVKKVLAEHDDHFVVVDDAMKRIMDKVEIKD